MNEVKDERLLERVLRDLTTYWRDEPSVRLTNLSGIEHLGYALISVASMDACLRHPEWGRAVVEALIGHEDGEKRAKMAAGLVRRVPVEVVS